MVNPFGGMRMVKSSLDAYGYKLDDEVLEKYIQEGNDPKKIKALIINYPNNPLGCTCTLEYLQHCVDFCNKHNLWLVEDNCDALGSQYFID